ncbi:MAG: hypothetical protein WC365_00725 [Candidatus Babeliales bacterium]|jgi:hypothetical protein
MDKSNVGVSGHEQGKSLLAAIFAMTAGFNRYANPVHTSKFEGCKIIPGIRNPKDSIRKAAIERRRKATKLSKLSRSKRRTIYYYNLRHPVKMYA